MQISGVGDSVCFAPLAKFTSELLFESAASKVTDYSQ